MSDIGERLVRDRRDPGITLSYTAFGAAVLGHLLDEFSEPQTLDALQTHIADNQGTPLTLTEQRDIRDMKAFYDSIPSEAKQNDYCTLLVWFTALLQEHILTVGKWDARFLGVSA